VKNEETQSARGQLVGTDPVLSPCPVRNLNFRMTILPEPVRPHDHGWGVYQALESLFHNRRIGSEFVTRVTIPKQSLAASWWVRSRPSQQTRSRRRPWPVDLS